MNPSLSKRLDGIGEYYFSRKLQEIDALNRSGENVINLGIGSPDLPPHPDVIRVLNDSALRTDTHAYQSYKGAPGLREAAAAWYQRWYGVALDPATEILPLIGSKEGIMHLCMTYLDAGDEALVPDPGYPTYGAAVKLSGADCRYYSLQKQGGFLPDLEALANEDLSKVKLWFLNYPHMPSGTQASLKEMEAMVAFARERNILIVHDNPYSFILNDQPKSMLAVDGAKEVVVELNSLSKSHNMAGWRVGFLCGAASRIAEVLRFKSNMDSGSFLPVQLAAARALALDEEWFTTLNETYRERRQKAHELLYEQLNCDYNTQQVGLFLWASVPDQYEDGYALSDAVLREARVFITPGGIFGASGKGFVRVSLCSTVETFDRAIERVAAAKKRGGLL